MMALLMGLKSISPADLLALAERRKVAIFDCNSRQSWASAHVPGAAHLDAQGYAAGQRPAEGATELVFSGGTPLCRRAPAPAKRAKRMGYDNVRVMSAGIS